MQVHSTNQCSFGRVKNTYLNQARNATKLREKMFFLSNHYEAKARCHYQKFLKNENVIDEISDEITLKDFMTLIDLSFNSAYHKVASFKYIIKSHIFNQ